MAEKIIISPVTRANGPFEVEVDVEGNIITDARCAGMYYRGFETMLKGRDPRESPYFTSRICGICSTAHSTAAAMALEDSLKIRVPENAYYIRNIIYGGDFIQNHIRHFYLLALPDYMDTSALGIYPPTYTIDRRFDANENRRLAESYREAIIAGNKAHQLVAVLNGKIPHGHGIVAGGATVQPNAERVSTLLSLISDLSDFIDRYMIPDTMLVAERYSDYYEIGRGYGNIISYGLFPYGTRSDQRESPAGVIIGGNREELNFGEVSENLSYSWYKEDYDDSEGIPTQPEPYYGKEGAYSWIKAPRYKGYPAEGGPIARQILSGLYPKKTGADGRLPISTMDRIVARSLETRQIATLLRNWIFLLKETAPIFTPPDDVKDLDGTGLGLTDSMRGALSHHVSIKKGRIEHYQIITPTAWNLSPRDDRGIRGPAEEALVGTVIASTDEPVEIGRILRSFDLCAACAVHVIRGGKSLMRFAIR